MRVPRKHEDTAAEFERFCKICHVELTSEVMAKIHFAGRKHVDRQLKLLSGRASTPSISDPRFSTGAAFDKDVEVREFVIEEDEDVKKCEQRGSEEGGTSPVSHAFHNKTDSFFCPLCNVKLESRIVYDQHLAGKKQDQRGSMGRLTRPC